MITGLNHANISTAKLQETIDFFVGVIGLEVGPRPDFTFAGAWLYAGAQPVLHLVERDAPRDPAGAIDHVSFTVTDLDTATRQLDQLGIPYRISITPGGFGRQAFLTDPNGIKIELTEPAANRSGLPPRHD